MCEQCVRLSSDRRTFLSRSLLVAGGLALPSSRRRFDVRSLTPQLEVHPRSDWADGLEPTGPLAPEEVRFLLVHHTATSNGYDEPEVPDILRQIYRFHTGPEKGWPDVCYNFFVDRFGGVWEGRQGSLDGPVMADATGGSQGFAQLVCLIGDFTAEMPTEAALGSLVRLLAWNADRFGLATTPGSTVEFVSRGSNRWDAGVPVVTPTIAGHRDMSATACPGDTFYPWVRESVLAAVDGVRALLTATTTQAPPTEPPATTAPEPTSTELAIVPSSAPVTVPTTVAATQAVASTATSSPDVDSGGSGFPWAGVGGGAIAVGAVAGLVAVRRRVTGTESSR